MRKWIGIMLILVLTCALLPTYAADMGVQVIGEESKNLEFATLDDVKLNVTIEVPENCALTATSYTVVDDLFAYKEGVKFVRYWDDHCDIYRSGKEADYAMLRVDILNLQLSAVDFLKEATVKVVSDDRYEFAGWVYQYDYDNKYYERNDKALADANLNYVINIADQFPINPMYTGHYAFGCTLPNAVVNAKTPLRIEVVLPNMEFTYHVRK